MPWVEFFVCSLFFWRAHIPSDWRSLSSLTSSPDRQRGYSLSPLSGCWFLLHLLFVHFPPPQSQLALFPQSVAETYQIPFLFPFLLSTSVSSAFPVFNLNRLESHIEHYLSHHGLNSCFLPFFFFSLASFSPFLFSCWHQSPACIPPLSQTEWPCQWWLEPAWLDARPGLVQACGKESCLF